MSITKEALAGTSAEPVRVEAYWDSSYTHIHDSRFLEQGLSILYGASVPGILEQLVEAIRPDFPDVELDPKPAVNLERGLVGRTMKWNIKYEDRGEAHCQYYDSLQVYARLLTKAIAISGAKGWEVLEEPDWKSIQVMEEAIKRGYSNPLKWGGEVTFR